MSNANLKYSNSIRYIFVFLQNSLFCTYAFVMAWVVMQCSLATFNNLNFLGSNSFVFKTKKRIFVFPLRLIKFI